MKLQKKRTPITLDKLALMVGEGFNQTHQQLDSMRMDMHSMKTDIVSIKSDVDELKEGQEHIKLRLDNVAYRFEIVEVQKRLERLEHKAGIKYH